PNVQALRRKGVDARLVVFNTRPEHPEADEDLRIPKGPSWRRQAAQFRALAKLLPTTDVFHFYFGLTLVPKRAQFPILKAARRKSVFHFVGSDIRGKSPEELAYGRLADAQIIGSYDAVRWIPEADVVPPGVDLSTIDPVPPRTAGPLGVDLPIVRTTKESLTEDLRALAASDDERLARGAAGRAYVERVHDADTMADRLLAIYSQL